MKVLLKFGIFIFTIVMIYGPLTGCYNKAYNCVDAGGLSTKEGKCLCDAYGRGGDCLSFAQFKTLTDSSGNELYFRGTGTQRGIKINNQTVQMKITESDQGLFFYSETPLISVFLPKTVAINDVEFVEGDCRFLFSRNTVDGDRYYKINGKSFPIKDPVDFSAKAICDEKLITSFVITDALGLREITLNDGRYFKLKGQD